MAASGGAKVVLLGEGRVGKTSLIRRFTAGQFSDTVAPTKPPVGASVFSKKRLNVDPSFVATARSRLVSTMCASGDGMSSGPSSVTPGGAPIPIVLQLWDTAGQERFQALGPIYYRGAAAALLVYDVTDSDSFRKARAWADELRSVLGSGVALAVAGNKVDLPERQRAVSRAEAERWCQEVNAVHFETSAKAGRGVEEAFVGLAAEIIARRDLQGGAAAVSAIGGGASTGLTLGAGGGGGGGSGTGLVLGGGGQRKTLAAGIDSAGEVKREKSCC